MEIKTAKMRQLVLRLTTSIIGVLSTSACFLFGAALLGAPLFKTQVTLARGYSSSFQPTDTFQSEINFSSKYAGKSIVHLFNYPFKLIEQELPTLASIGFKYIQISPPQLSRKGNQWFDRYQPLDYRIIDGPLGSEEDLRRLVGQAKRLGIGIIADVVLNHMADLGYDYNLSYPPQWVREEYDIEPLFHNHHFNPAFCIRDYSNQAEVRLGRLCRAGETRGGLPDLDLSQSYVQAVHKEYLRKLDSIGVEGFRLDAAKHMDLEYFNEILDGQYFAENKLLFAEVIANRYTYDRDIYPFLKETGLKLMDFPLQTTMKEAFSWDGDIRLLLANESTKMSLPENRAITFVINHDIPNNEEFRYLILNQIDEKLAHIFMFARGQGIPHVYSDLGKEDGLTSDRWLFFHRKPIIRAGVKFHESTSGFSPKILYADNCVLVIARGVKGIASINKCTKPIKVPLNIPSDLKYLDLISNESLMIKDGFLSIPSRTGYLFIREF